MTYVRIPASKSLEKTLLKLMKEDFRFISFDSSKIHLENNYECICLDFDNDAICFSQADQSHWFTVKNSRLESYDNMAAVRAKRVLKRLHCFSMMQNFTFEQISNLWGVTKSYNALVWAYN